MQPPLISEYFPRIVFDRILKDRVPVYQVLYNAGVDIDLVLNGAGEYVPFTGKIIKFDAVHAFERSRNSRYHWTYASEFVTYYKKMKEIIDGELIFPPLPGEHNQKIAKEIEGCTSVGIHIRQGDFVKLRWTSSPEYYKKCVEWAEKEVHPDRYFIFSDDQEYCKNNMDAYGFTSVENKVVFVSGNRGLHDYVDFQLMTLCHYLVLTPRSSFSFCAHVFNKHQNPAINWKTIGMEFKDSFGWKRPD